MNHDQAAAERAQQNLDRMHVGLGAFYEVVADGIDRLGESDPEAAFTLATTYQRALRQLHDQEDRRASRLRARQASRIRDRDALSLAGLADRIGVSRSRAGQFTDLAKEAAVTGGPIAEQAKEHSEMVPTLAPFEEASP